MPQPGNEEEVAAQRVGMVLRGKYRLDRVLGVGGMGAVYEATHRNQKRFAIKMLRPELSLSADVRARFVREGYAANSLEHRGAVAVLDDDVAEDGAAFLVMELLDGITLDEVRRRRHRPSTCAVLAIGSQLLDVLASAEQKAVLHRDIKPANIFITREGVVKLLDFGIARVRDAAGAASSQTQTGALLGTPAFMSPEQARGKLDEIDARSDIWAAAATMFNLVTGRTVHIGETTQMLLVKSATVPAPPLLSLAPATFAPVAALVDRGLAFSKDDRFPSAAAMKSAIDEAHRALSGTWPSQEALANELFGVDERTLNPESLLAGLSTPTAAPKTAGKSIDGVVSSRIVSPPRSALPALLAAIALAAAVIVAAVIYVRRRSPATLVASASAATSPAPPAASPLPPPVVSVALPVPPPAVVPDAAVSIARKPPAPAVATAAPKKKDTPCDPNYTLDERGEKHFKPECF